MTKKMKTKKKELIKKLDKAFIEHRHYPEAIYADVYEAVDNYMRDTDDYSLESVFNDYAEEEWVNFEVENRLKAGGYVSVWNLLNSIKETESVYKMSVYGYLENLTLSDMEALIYEIKERLKEK